jgi:hypothetical protein
MAVVAIESPVFWLGASRRVANAAHPYPGRLSEGLQYRTSSRSTCGETSFLWRSDMTTPPVRDRSDLPQSAKKIEYVAPEEIHAAIEQAIRESYGVANDEVPIRACRLLGFFRVTDKMRAAVDKDRDALIDCGRLILKGGNVVLAEGRREDESRPRRTVQSSVSEACY